jgi:multimeric flavodoxin WrbA
MRVSVILGSPRRGSNSAKLAEAVVAALEEKKPEVSTFRLNDLKIRGCQACFACKTKAEACVIEDDLARVLAASSESDLVILASPIFIGEITAQMKIFVDRSYSWFKPDFVQNPSPSRVGKGKTLILIVTQGDPDKGAYKRNLDFYAGYFSNHGFAVKTFLAAGLQKEDIALEKPELLEAAKELAKAV